MKKNSGNRNQEIMIIRKFKEKQKKIQKKKKTKKKQ